MRVLACAAAALLATVAPPAHAVGSITTEMAYAGNGTLVFTCHALATGGPTTAKLGSSTMVSCSVNGVRSTQHTRNGWHAHGAGTVDGVAVGSVAQFCIDASTVYGLFPPLFVEHEHCVDVVVAAGGGVVDV